MTEETPAIDEIGSRVEEGFAKLTQGLSAADVFGEPSQVGDHVVITAATIERAGGFGFGGGYDESSSGGGGGGGGGKAEGRAIAIIDIGPDGVEVRPIVDVTRLGITVLMAFLSVLRRR